MKNSGSFGFTEFSITRSSKSLEVGVWITICPNRIRDEIYLVKLGSQGAKNGDYVHEFRWNLSTADKTMMDIKIGDAGCHMTQIGDLVIDKSPHFNAKFKDSLDY